jgi:hypothetical protein
MKLISSSSIFALLPFAMMTRSSLGEDLTIGDWTIPSNGSPYPPVEINVGDTITFSWTGTHNVQINPSMSCDMTDTVVVGDTSPTSYTFVDADGSSDGTTHLFVCGIGNGAHCEAGKADGLSTCKGGRKLLALTDISSREMLGRHLHNFFLLHFYFTHRSTNGSHCLFGWGGIRFCPIFQ